MCVYIHIHIHAHTHKYICVCVCVLYNHKIIKKRKDSRLSGWMRRSLQQAVNCVLAASSAPAGPARPRPSSAGWDCCGHLSLAEFSGVRVDEDTCSFLWSTAPAFRNERKGGEWFHFLYFCKAASTTDPFSHILRRKLWKFADLFWLWVIKLECCEFMWDLNGRL